LVAIQLAGRKGALQYNPNHSIVCHR
jgi:hypothetical protein